MGETTKRPRIVLLFSSPDRPGIVVATAEWIGKSRNGYGKGNIIDSMQHYAADTGRFFMRVEWEMDARDALDQSGLQGLQDALRADFAETAGAFAMEYQIWVMDIPQRMAIMVSKELHCLYDLLWQYQEKQLPHCRIACVISNHREAEELCVWAGIPFHHTPRGEGQDSKERLESAQLDILGQEGVDLIVLARYMQILSGDFIDRFRNQIINIHHSFLPAFVGAKPYHQAYARGVKIIGATSHYATVDLDQGPIIEQDVARVSHRDDIQTIIRRGNVLERTVLSHAVRLHLAQRILTVENKTIVFH